MRKVWNACVPVVIGAATVWIAAAGERMPVARQNALVAKYCAACHTDATMTGGLTLERFDAARVDPSLAAMLVSKMKDGAFGAAGLPLPDKETQGALISALSAEGSGAKEWTVRREKDATTASIVQELPSTMHHGSPDVYRLVVTCHEASGEGEMQVAWSPADVEGAGAVLSAAADGGAAVAYPVYNGDGAAVLSELPLPEEKLTIRGVFPGAPVVFSFTALPPAGRESLTKCFARNSSAR